MEDFESIFDDLVELETFLLKQGRINDDTMLLEELDGFLTALVICPVQIPEEESENHIWSQTGDPSQKPVFRDAAEAGRIRRLIGDHRHRIGSSLKLADGYQPLFGIDENSEELIWEVWIEGFHHGMRLAPDYWLSIADTGPEQPKFAVSALLNLNSIVERESNLPQGIQDEATAMAPELIPAMVRVLYDYARGRTELTAADGPILRKVGRNDPCPCGSGKKYKKCHGA